MPQSARHHSTNAPPSHDRQPYHHPHTSLGATGHWLKTAGILAPLVISEFVTDHQKQWRYIRIASVATGTSLRRPVGSKSS